MNKVIVTGAAGFIGSHIAEELVNQGYEVVGIDDLSTGRKSNIEHVKDKMTFVEGSILDTSLLAKAFEGASFVFHQAALPSVPKSIEMPRETNAANVEGTLNVFIAARDAGVKRVVYASSSSVYGDSPTLPKVETMPFNPLSPYAAQKMMDELYGRMFYKFYGLETAGLRYFNVFGPRQDPNSKYAAVIPNFITKIANDEGITINGDGTITRDFTFVKNVVNANIAAATTSNAVGGEVFNIACGDSISLNDLVAKIGTHLSKTPKASHGPMRAGDIEKSLADISKAKQHFGYEPEVSFDEGLKRTIQSIVS